MAAFVTVLFTCFLASHARAVPPAPVGLAELQAALGEGGLEDAQESGLALRRLGLATGSNRWGVQGAHLNPLDHFLNPLDHFLRTFIQFTWRILSAFLRT